MPSQQTSRPPSRLSSKLCNARAKFYFKLQVYINAVLLGIIELYLKTIIDLFLHTYKITNSCLLIETYFRLVRLLRYKELAALQSTLRIEAIIIKRIGATSCLASRLNDPTQSLSTSRTFVQLGLSRICLCPEILTQMFLRRLVSRPETLKRIQLFETFIEKKKKNLLLSNEQSCWKEILLIKKLVERIDQFS